MKLRHHDYDDYALVITFRTHNRIPVWVIYDKKYFTHPSGGLQLTKVLWVAC
jgi:hypothetical protein